MTMQPGTIGRYRVLRELGHGGMGSVYLAHDPAIDRRVAIKTITLSGPEGSRGQEEARRRFLREARAAGRLQHPNIISVYDVGTYGTGSLFIAMEYLVGPTLEAFTHRADLLPVEKVLSLVSDACLALDYAHRWKIVHRDIKPSNMMLVEGERLKITDFGIAKDHRTNVTQCGLLLGTPNYMSPEQAMGRDVDGRSDLFSLGVVLYELLSGERPFEGDSISAVLYQLVHEEPKEARILNDRLPERFHLILRTALHKHPASRFQTGREMAEALRNYRRFEASPAQTVVMGAGGPALSPAAGFRAGAGAATPPVPPARASRRGLRVAALLGLAVALGALAVPPYRPAWVRTILPAVERFLRPSSLTVGARTAAGAPGTGAAAERPVKLELTADRPGARFYLEGVPVEGDTLLWERRLDGRLLSASDGCFRGQARLEAPVEPGGAPLEVRLTEAVTQRVRLTSQPDGAEVELDGSKVDGRTPVTVALAACADHRVELSLTGFRSRTLDLPSGGDWQGMTGAPLQLEALPDGSLIFDAPYPVTIRANGRAVGSSGEVLSLPPGSHELTFESQEHRVRVTKVFEVESGSEGKLGAPVPPLGTVRVLAYPGNALIVVDGIPAEPPPAVLELGAGEHRLECRWNIGERPKAHKTVLVRVGQSLSVHFRDEKMK